MVDCAAMPLPHLLKHPDCARRSRRPKRDTVAPDGQRFKLHGTISGVNVRQRNRNRDGVVPAHVLVPRLGLAGLAGGTVSHGVSSTEFDAAKLVLDWERITHGHSVPFRQVRHIGQAQHHAGAIRSQRLAANRVRCAHAQ